LHRHYLPRRYPGDISDLPREYQLIAQNRNPDYQREKPLALINAKDVANPAELTKERAVCDIKMTRACFESFLMAFKDPESRIRLSGSGNEEHYSKIKSVAVEGGYLDGLSVEMSGHLDTVIGGRGSGKSTLLQCIRYALDVPHKGQAAMQEAQSILRANLGDAGGRVVLQVQSAANHMQDYTVVRRYGEPPRVIDSRGNESTLHPGRDLLPGIEIYGQNEIHELAKDPNALTRVLDRFLPAAAENDRQLETLYQRLQDNAGRLGKALQQREELEEQFARLPRLEEQLQQFKSLGVEDKLKQLPLLEKERQLEPRIRSELYRAATGIEALRDSLPDLTFTSDTALNHLPHASELRQCRSLLNELGAKLQASLTQCDSALSDGQKRLEQMLDQLTSAINQSETTLVKEFSDLPAMAGQSGTEVGRAYQQLLRQIEQIRPAESRKKTVDELVSELEQQRRNLLGEISDLRSARLAAKQKAVKHINKRLRGKLRIVVLHDGLRTPLLAFLQSLPGVGKSKTAWADDADITIPALVDAIRNGEKALDDKKWGITKGMRELLVRLPAETLYKLEAIDLQERVSLELNVSHDSEHFRELDRLSTGQQCTAILHLLLLDNNDPLIMDQPEDNLDNAFIAERIVREIRSAKNRRQFVFATHNANIPVFGDAEWIGVCEAGRDQPVLANDAQGSIDIPAIREKVALVLEGGRDAFLQRKEKYGYNH